MPVRSLRSSVLKWPNAAEIDRAFRLDVIVIVGETDEPFMRRCLSIDTAPLPVSCDVLVYTQTEWAKLAEDSPFHRRIAREAVWL